MASSSSERVVKRSTAFVPLRLAILGACLGWFSRKALKPILLPHGPAQPFAEVPTWAPIDMTNDLLMEKHGKLSKIYERVEEGQSPLMRGPETVFFDDNGTMYTTTDYGDLISLTDFATDKTTGKITAKATKIKDLGVGRPLGAKFIGSTLYIADPVMGLMRVSDVFDPKSKAEVVATTVVDGGKETRILFADDVAVAPSTGMVYFTDATNVPPKRDNSMFWDVMYSSKVEALRGPSGRLMQYDPSKDKVTVLARDLMFANGVAVGDGEQYIVFVETFKGRVTKYYIDGEKKGSMEYVLDGGPSPAWFDGIDCRWKGDSQGKSLCYVVGPTSVVPAAKLLFSLPSNWSRLFRTIVLMLPKWMTPEPEPYASIEIIDPETKTYVGIIQDPSGKDISRLTGITYHDDKLYLGSLHNDFIGVYDLV